MWLTLWRCLQEVLDYFSQPDSLRGDLPPEIENYDALPFFLAAMPITLSVLGIQLVHEIAHAAVAATRKVRVLPTLLISEQPLL